MREERLLSVKIEEADPRVLLEVRQLLKAPSDDPAELKKHVATLAKAILEVEKHCASLQAAFTTLVKSAQFTTK